MLINHILKEQKLYELEADDKMDFNSLMIQIPDGYKLIRKPGTPEEKVFKWDKNSQKWLEATNNVDLKPGQKLKYKEMPMELVNPDEPDLGYTQYTAQWRDLIRDAINRINDQSDDKKNTGKNVDKIQPLNDGDQAKYGKVDYIYNITKGQWFEKETLRPVHPTSELHVALMAKKGFDVDGTTELSASGMSKLIATLDKVTGGKYGALSRTQGKSWLAKYIGGPAGDFIGRMSKKGYLDFKNKAIDKEFDDKIDKLKKLRPDPEETESPEEKFDTPDGEEIDISDLDKDGTTDIVPTQDQPEKIPLDKNGREYLKLVKSISRPLNADYTEIETNDKRKLKRVGVENLKVNDIFYYIGQETSGKPGKWIKGKIKFKPKPNDTIVTVSTQFSPFGFPLTAWKIYVPLEDAKPADYEARPDDAKGRQRTFNKTKMKSKVEFFKQVNLTPVEDRPYAILGVNKNATGKEIKSAYLKLAVIYHPDSGNNPDEAIMKAINDAKDKLIDKANKLKNWPEQNEI